MALSTVSAAVPAAVALIAVDAVVHIPADLRVLEVVGVVAPVATGALKDGVVIGIGVACGAHVVRLAVTRREGRVLRVIKSRPGPGRCVVAGLAGRREKLRLRRVARVRGVVVVRLVAADAGRRQCGVVAVDMAIGALSRGHRMGSGQGKRRIVVIEGGIRPDRRVMAQLALLRESRSDVIGIRRALEVFQMARDACGAVQTVVVIDVAIRALARGHRVRAGQGESGGGVIELAIRPLHGVVALFTGSWETGVRHR